MHIQPMQPGGPEKLAEVLQSKHVYLTCCHACKQSKLVVNPNFLVLGPDRETENPGGAHMANQMLVEVRCPKCGYVMHFNYATLIA